MTPDTLSRYVVTVLKGICWHPEDSSSGFKRNGDRVRITFEPHPADFRYCMGDGGRCVRGLQRVAFEIGRLHRYQPSVSLLAPLRELPREEHEFTKNTGFDHSEILRTIGDMLTAAFGHQVALTVNGKGEALEISVPAKDPNETQVIAALSEPIYAYGYRHGRIIKLIPNDHR